MTGNKIGDYQKDSAKFIKIEIIAAGMTLGNEGKG